MFFSQSDLKIIGLVNSTLEGYLKPQYPEIIYDAMNYSVKAGGKRIRATLLMYSAKLCGGDINDALPFAAAIEMIHTYSLIHDDLPALDNDDFRRGQPSNHKKFGESFALLAGDALLNISYEIMSAVCEKRFEARFVKAMNIIARAAGVTGMIGGQTADVMFENKTASESELLYIHSRKTGALIQAAILAGAEIAEADEHIRDVLKLLGEKLGLAFQISDDILDVTASYEKLGKPLKSDEKNAKTTFISLYGLENAMERYESLRKDILDLTSTLDNGGYFYGYTNNLLSRDC